MAVKRTIWQNFDININEWSDFLKDEHPDVADEYEKFRLVQNLNDQYLEDERMNLSSAKLDEDVVIIADLGRWNGRVMGYKVKSANNIGDLLYLEGCADYAEFYIDNYKNFRSRQADHDGTSYYLYRMWKPNLSDTQKENFLNKIYYGKVTSKDITRYTVSLGKEIAKIYGW